MGSSIEKTKIWRDKVLKFKSGQVIQTELITKDFARVTYTLESFVENEKFSGEK